MTRLHPEGYTAPIRTRTTSHAQRFEDRLRRRFNQAAYCWLRDRIETSSKAVRAAADLRWRNQDG